MKQGRDQSSKPICNVREGLQERLLLRSVGCDNPSRCLNRPIGLPGGRATEIRVSIPRLAYMKLEIVAGQNEGPVLPKIGFASWEVGRQAPDAEQKRQGRETVSISVAGGCRHLGRT